MARSPEPPPGALVLRTYQQLDQFVEAFATGTLNLLVILGRPGVQKSRAVKAAVGRRACWIDGSATAFGLYCQLYRHRDRPVVIDDVDGLYADRAAVRLLKCLCQTEPKKRLGWHSAAAVASRHGIPPSFETTSRVALLANELRCPNVNVSAVLDRGHVVLFDPSARLEELASGAVGDDRQAAAGGQAQSRSVAQQRSGAGARVPRAAGRLPGHIL